MNVLIFGATGMIGQGVLRDCVNDPSIGRIGIVLRRPPQTPDPRVEVILVAADRGLADPVGAGTLTVLGEITGNGWPIL